MEKKVLELSKHFLLYGLSSAMQSFVGFLILPLFTRYINAIDFGAYSLMVFYTSLISSIFYFGTTASLNRFYFAGDSDYKIKKNVVSSNFFISIGGAFLQLILSFMFLRELSNWMFPNNNYFFDFKILLIASSIGLISNYFLAILRVLNKSNVYFMVNVIAALINLIITSLFIVKYNFGILAPILGLLCGNVTVMGLTYYFIYKNFTFDVDFSIIKSCFKFGTSIIFLGLCFSFLDWVDRILLERYTTLREVGIYSFGYRIGIIVYVIFSVPFSMAWSTIRMEKLNTPNYDLFTSRVVTIYSIVGWFLVLVFSLFINEILLLIGGKKEYFEAINVIPIILSAYLIYGYVSIFDIGIFLSKKMYYYIISFIICIIFNVGLNVLLIPYFGYMAAAFNTLFTYIIYILLIYIFSNKFFKYNLEFLKLIKIIFPVLLILTCNAIIGRYFVEINFLFILCKIILIISYLIFIWVTLLTYVERIFILEKFKRFNKKSVDI